MLARIVPDVVREHAELAALPVGAARYPVPGETHQDPAVIARIDRRLEANLDGLRIAGAAAWPFIIDQYEDYPEKGELFVVAVMALEQQDERRIAQAVAFARNGEHGTRGLCGAFEWLPPKITAPLVRTWMRRHGPRPEGQELPWPPSPGTGQLPSSSRTVDPRRAPRSGGACCGACRLGWAPGLRRQPAGAHGRSRPVGLPGRRRDAAPGWLRPGRANPS